MAVKFSPIFNSQVVDSTGAPASGWKVYTYVAVSSTPLATYTTSAGSVAQTNPIVLNSLGFPTTGQIWLTAGQSYKLVLTNAADVVQKTEDNVAGVNDTSVSIDQWVDSGLTPTYVSGTSFTLAGDQTTAFQVGRRVKCTVTAGTVYGRISASAYAALTTVTVVNDSGVLDSGLSAVGLGLLTPTNPSTPVAIDTYPLVSGSSDQTKLVRLEVDGLTTATTRVLTPPDTDTKIGPAVIAVCRNVAARTNSSTPNSKIDITADEILLKDSNSLGLLASTVSVTIDIAASGANGLDTGAEASNTWYYGWVIAKSDGTIAGLISASATAPTMPAGYTFKALATAVRNNGSSNFIPYRQEGSWADFDAKQSVLSFGAATTETAVSLASFVPPIAQRVVLYAFLNMNSTAGGFASGTGTLRTISGSDQYALMAIGNFASDAGRDTAQVTLGNIGQNVYYIMSSSGSINQNQLTLDVMGFKLPMGGE